MDWNELFHTLQSEIRTSAEAARKSVDVEGDGEAGSTVRLEPVDAESTAVILDAKIIVKVRLAEILKDLKIKPESPFPARLEGKGFALDI